MASFDELRIARLRSWVLLFLLLWDLGWGYFDPSRLLEREAAAALPWIFGLLLPSLAWSITLRAVPWLRRVGGTSNAEIAGLVFNLIIIAALLTKGFYLLIAVVAVIPFLSVSIGARYGTRVFVLVIVVSNVVVFVSAPPGFWLNWPGYALLALALFIALPLLLMRMLDELRHATFVAVTAKDSQSRFVSIMSHELRTPLSAIIGGAELIDSSTLDADQRSLMQAIVSNASALRSRVSHMLNAAALDAGNITANLAPVNLPALLQSTVDARSPIAHHNKVKLQLAIHDHVAMPVLSDAGLIEQLLTNLLHNAIKYSPRGGEVRVRMHISPSAARPEHQDIAFEVSDSGSGIPDGAREAIFEPFNRLDAPPDIEHESVGLGLHIVKRISELLGGVLEIDDNLGGGAVFRWRVTLPVSHDAVVDKPLDTLSALDVHRSRVMPLRVLAIDDKSSNQQILSAMLKRAGHSLISAMDGRSGLEAIRKGRLDIVLLDLNMPGMSGWQVLKALRRESEAMPVPPIVVLSAESGNNEESKAISHGAMGFLAKPISIPTLLAILERIANGTVSRQHEGTTRSPLDEVRTVGTQEDVADYLVASDAGFASAMRELDTASHRGDAPTCRSALHALRNEFLNQLDTEGAVMCSDFAADLATHEIAPYIDFTFLRARVSSARMRLRAQPEFPVNSHHGETPSGQSSGYSDPPSAA